MSVYPGPSPFTKPLQLFRRTSAVALCAAGLASAQHSSTITLPDSIMAPGTVTAWVQKVSRYCEGPATDGNIVYFTEQHAKSDNSWPIWRRDLGNPSDTGKQLVVQSNQSNGLFVDAQHRLLAAQNGKLVRYTAAGTLDTTFVASPSGGVSFGQANDFSFGKNGAIYFTDHTDKVYYLDPSRTLKVAISGLKAANGVEWIEEQNSVYVLETSGNQISKFDINPDGTLKLNKKFAGITSPDGADLDIHGNWYVGSYGEGAVHVLNAAGEDIGKIVFKQTENQPFDATRGQGGNICNCHFGGEENKTLFCTGDGGMYSIKLKIPGRAWPAAGTTALNAASRPLSPSPEKTGSYRIDGRFWKAGFDKNAAGPAKPILPMLDAAAAR